MLQQVLFEHFAIFSVHFDLPLVMFCRVLVCFRWVYMTSAATTKLIRPVVPWLMPMWFIRYIAGKQVSAQGMGRHTPKEVKQIGQGDLGAIEAFIGKRAVMACFFWQRLDSNKIFCIVHLKVIRCSFLALRVKLHTLLCQALHLYPAKFTIKHFHLHL